MNPIQLRFTVTLDETILGGLSELIRIGVENGNKNLTSALAEAIEQWAMQPKKVTEPSPKLAAIPVKSSNIEDYCQLLEAADVAKMLGISPRTVWRLKDVGKLPKPVSVGSLVRWRREEINDWISSGCPPIVRWKWTKRR